MKSVSFWTKDFQSVVDDGRNHSVVIDLPVAKGGSNSGPTGIELCVMSLSGCIGTVFAMMAQKMRISFTKMQVEVYAEQDNNAPTITDVSCILSIRTTEEKDKIEKCLEHTINSCPVGVLFRQAGVEITNEINYI
jgi:putative redox protein